VTRDEARGSIWPDLVSGLLDTRTDPASDRFDAELASAVASGELSRRTAQRLRFWQRAAVNAADHHARTVVPAVLGVLETARSEAQADVERGAATLDEEDAGHTAAPEAPHQVAGAEAWWAASAATPPRADAAADATTAAQQAEAATTSTTRIEDLRRASASGAERPSTLEGRAPRLFVADLRDVPATERP
jgi:hypothetical protein